MKTRKEIVIIMMALVAILAMFPSCAASAFEITELPVDYEKIETLRIETPRRNTRTVTHVEVLTGKTPSVKGWIRDYSMNGSTLTIKLGGDLVITMPYENNVKYLDLAIASGSIRVDGFESLERIDAASAEGDITFRNIGKAKSLNADSTNGNIRIDGRDIGKVDANTISGDIEFKGKADRLTLSGISGDIRVMTDEKVDVSFDSLTGRRDYSSTPNADMKIKASSISGGLSVKAR